MDVLISSISNAYEEYIDVANAVLDEYHIACGLQTEATNQALEKLIKQRQCLLSACDDAEVYIHMTIQRVSEFKEAHHIEAIEPVMKNLDHMHKLLVLFSWSCKTLTSCFDLMLHQVRTLEAAICTNAAEPAPVALANAERRQPSARDGGAAHVTGEHNMTASPVLSDIDLNSASQRQSNPAQLHQTWVLSELDPKNTD